MLEPFSLGARDVVSVDEGAVDKVGETGFAEFFRCLVPVTENEERAPGVLDEQPHVLKGVVPVFLVVGPGWEVGGKGQSAGGPVLWS